MLSGVDPGPELEASVASVLVQTRAVARLVVVDRSSVDAESVRLLGRLGGGRVTVLRDPSGFPAGTSTCDTDHVLWIEPGLVAPPRFLEVAEARLAASPALVWLLGRVAGTGGAVWPRTLDDAIDWAGLPVPLVFRRGAWEGLSPTPRPLAQIAAWDISLRAAERGTPGGVLEAPVVTWLGAASPDDSLECALPAWFEARVAARALDGAALRRARAERVAARRG